MRILLVRHGESEGNVNPQAYIDKGDTNVGLTDKGWEQAFGAGRFLGQFYADTGTGKWPVVYLSSYLRPKQTFRGIFEGVKGQLGAEPKLYEDPRLIEKFFGAASHLYHPPEGLSAEDKIVREALLLLSKSTYENDPFTAKNLFGDSTKDTFVAVKSFLDGTFARDRHEGKDDFLIVCHGAVIQAFLMSWAHLPIASKNRLGNPGNCDIIKIEGSPKNWTFTQIYDGEEMQAVEREALKDIKPFSIQDLPPAPNFS